MTPNPDAFEEKEIGTVLLNKNDREKKDSSPNRDEWQGKLDFVMSALSFAVGMGNLWRFPYLVYSNGGGAFLIPYIIMVILAGFPLLFLEFAFGQFGRLGVVSIWKAVPLMQGIGWCMFFISLISCIYYNMIVAISFFYFFASFTSDVPWRTCGSWSTKNCERNLSSVDSSNTTLFENLTSVQNTSKSASDEYFHQHVLNISDGVDNLGGVQWKLALCLLLSWAIVFICLSKGIKTSGKATYVTSTFPYVILIILLIRGLTLEGSMEGIKYYVLPDWKQLASAKVWGDAAVQVFFSMSTCWGGLITLASYNNYRNNCFRDALVVAVGDGLTSIFGGFVIFSIIGYMAHELNVPVEDVATQGAGLAFVVYPQAVTMLPLSPLWAILFMLMLLNLGLGTQFTLVTTVHTTIMDVFQKYFKVPRRRILLLLTICIVCYLFGLTCATRGGMYVLQLMDKYAPSYGLLTVGLAECIALSWLYGIDKFFKDIESMIGRPPLAFFFKICWQFLTPVSIIFILLFTFADFKRSKYDDYIYPLWADGIGWLIALFEISCIPATAIYKLYTTKGDLIERIKKLIKPSEEWGHELKTLELKEFTLTAVNGETTEKLSSPLQTINNISIYDENLPNSKI
ncbi:DgyrCDS3637 [Dimorphilus gyrociliatus]|uniref:Transporter n=1 Tax=Dimorphilus gyrociliatus TaxID=2664684 RepID=A0A7I8VE39_9ANNE|nr:DgyrCDS3637 [Dimorphilus gyrociliatus]